MYISKNLKNMQVKGTAVRSISDFVKNKYPDRFVEWLSALPPESQKLFRNGALSNEWYPIKYAAIEPTRIVSDLFYTSLRDGAWDCGRYSAETALSGIYKIYVMMANPGHIIERASRVFQAYYQPCEMAALNRKNKSVEVAITKFSMPDQVIEYRIGGWMEKALEISGCKNINVNVVLSMTKGEKQTLFQISWE